MCIRDRHARYSHNDIHAKIIPGTHGDAEKVKDEEQIGSYQQNGSCKTNGFGGAGEDKIGMIFGKETALLGEQILVKKALAAKTARAGDSFCPQHIKTFAFRIFRGI